MERGVGLKDANKWYSARATFLGLNWVLDMEKGLKLASECTHPDAKWLCEVFPLGAPDSVQEAVTALLSLGQEDGRAVCFAAFLEEPSERRELMGRSANWGYLLAEAWVVYDTYGMHDVSLCTQKALDARDPDAITFLAHYLRHRGESGALRLYKEAAQLDNPEAQYWMARLGYDHMQPERYVWLRKALGRGATYNESNVTMSLQEYWQTTLLDLVEEKVPETSVFDIGAALKEHLASSSPPGGALFVILRKKLCKVARDTMSWHEYCCRRANKAISTWLVIARNHLNKDVRHMIAKILLADRGAWGNQQELRDKFNPLLHQLEESYMQEARLKKRPANQRIAALEAETRLLTQDQDCVNLVAVRREQAALKKKIKALKAEDHPSITPVRRPRGNVPEAECPACRTNLQNVRVNSNGCRHQFCSDCASSMACPTCHALITNRVSL
jgi:hypothetical protein